MWMHGQLVDRDAERRERVGRYLSADAHAVVPAREPEIKIGADQHFARGVAFGQFWEFGDTGTHFFIELVPARDAGIADHPVCKAEHEHHFSQVDVVRGRARRGVVECDLAVAALYGHGVGECGTYTYQECERNQSHG